MVDEAQPFHAEYEVVFDPQASLRINRALTRSFWGEWMIYVIRISIILSAFILLDSIFLLYFIDRKDPMAVMLSAPILGLLFGLGWTIQIIFKRLAIVNKGADKGWKCVMTEDAWSYTDPEGCSVSIPWKIMRIRREHPEGWYLEFGRQKTSLIVFRKPLQDAGLEEEFRKRIPRKG